MNLNFIYFHNNFAKLTPLLPHTYIVMVYHGVL